MVPIVLGPSRHEYEQVAPKHSFIHVNDFDSPNELANYLFYLDKNDTAYNEYFQWHNFGQLNFNTFTACRMCMLAHEMENIGPHWYENFDKWWTDGCSNQQKLKL